MSSDIGNPGTESQAKGPKTGSGCNGVCVRYKAKKPASGGRYENGQKRCQVCEVFLKTDEMWCPCCGLRLRSKPRNSKYKAKLRASNGQD